VRTLDAGKGQIIRPATLPATSAFPESASHIKPKVLSDSHVVAGNPGHASSQGAAFYAQDSTSDISVCTVSGYCHGTKHGLSYTKPSNAKHDNERTPGYHQHAAWNDDLNRNHFHDRLWFHGNAANVPTRKQHQRQPVGHSGNAGRCRERRISNRWDARHHADTNGNFYHGGAMHAFQ
jgi:hypothetical protein